MILFNWKMRLYGRLEVIGSSRKILTILINSMIHCSPDSVKHRAFWIKLSHQSKHYEKLVSNYPTLYLECAQSSALHSLKANYSLHTDVIMLLFTIVFSTYRILDSAWWPREEVRSSSGLRLLSLDLLRILGAVTCSRFQPLQDCSCFSRDGILYPRPRLPAEAGTWTRSCYTAQPSWPGACPGDPGDPETQTMMRVRPG